MLSYYRMVVVKNCSPLSISDPSTDTKLSCIPKHIIPKIAEALDINPKGSLTTVKKRIDNELKKSNCSGEWCYEFDMRIKEGLTDEEYEELTESFRPIMPEKWLENETTWLNTSDIDNALEQYEESHPEFKYYNANPIDFDKKDNYGQCSVSDLCKLDLVKDALDGKPLPIGRKIRSDELKKTKFGMVFNVDPSTKGGQHWFSLFVDLVGQNLRGRPGIYHFDSVGRKDKEDISDEVNALITKIYNDAHKLGITLEVFMNDKNYQKENTECGIYCIHFLDYMLCGGPKGKSGSFLKYIRKRLSDKDMLSFRDKFFIKPKK